MWIIFKAFIELVTVLFLFWCSDHKAYGIAAPQPGNETTARPTPHPLCIRRQNPNHWTEREVPPKV